MNEHLVGDLSVIGLKGSEQFIAKVDAYLREWRGEDSFIITPELVRFAGETIDDFPSIVMHHSL